MKKKKNNNSPSSLNFSSEERKRVLPPDSGNRTPQTPQNKKEEVRENSIPITFHLTVRSRILDLGRRAITMIGGFLLREMYLEGINLERYILGEYLLARLCSGREPLELKNETEREISMLIYLVLSEQQPEFGIANKLSEEKLSILNSSKYVPSERSYYSWKSSWSWSIYFEILTVPVENLLERNSNSEPYSSYCKGYGESGPDFRKKKTRFSSELDGEPVNLFEEGERFSLRQINIMAYYLVQKERNKVLANQRRRKEK